MKGFLTLNQAKLYRMVRNAIISVLFVIVELFVVRTYLVYLADKVASSLGYFLAVVLLPFLVGVLFGIAYLAFRKLKSNLFKGVRDVLVVGAFGFLGLLPILHIFVIMTTGMGK